MTDSKTVLLLSDDAPSSETTAACLREVGAETRVHNDIEQVIPALNELHPLFVIVDVDAPPGGNAQAGLRTLRPYASVASVPLMPNGRASRVTFVFGRDGKLAKVFPAVKPQGHAREISDALAALGA